MDRYLYLYDYVPRPYPRLRDLLAAAGRDLLETAAAGARRRSDELRVRLLPSDEDVGPVVVEVQGFEEAAGPLCRLRFRWTAVRMPRAFPSVEGVLELIPLSSGETEVRIVARYRLPAARLPGSGVGLHRLAEATLHDLFTEILAGLRRPPALEWTA